MVLNVKFTYICFACQLLFFCALAQDLQTKQINFSHKHAFDYDIYLPKHYTPTGKPLGLLVFLHGGGQSQNFVNKKEQTPLFKAVATGTNFPFVVIAPRLKEVRQWWNIFALNEFITTITQTYNINKKKLYLSGISRGANAAWQLTVNYPNKFAALHVVSGMPPIPYAHWLSKNLAIWVFHGVKDTIMPITQTDLMVQKLKMLGFTIKYNRLLNKGHQINTIAYNTKGLFSWINAQSLP